MAAEGASPALPDSGRNPADSPRVIVAALAAASAGLLLYNVLPLFLGAMQDGHSLSSSQTGLLGTAFFAGFNIAGVSAVWWVRRLAWRTVALAMVPLVVVSLMLTAGDTGYPALFAATLACGTASGVIYTIGSVIIGDTSRPERWYGLKVSMESLAGTILLLLLPATLIPRMGMQGAVAGIILMVLLLSLALILLPRTWDKQVPTPTGPAVTKPVLDPVGIGLAVLSLLLLCAGGSAIWSFAERMARVAGFDPDAVGGLLAASLAAGIAGSLVVVFFGSRIPAARAYLLATSVVLIGLLGIAAHGSFALYALGSCLYIAGWSAGTPLACAEIARLDLDGRFVALLVPAIGIGSMIGPGVAGWLMDVTSPAAVFAYSGGAVVVAALTMLVAGRRADGAGAGKIQASVA